MASAVDLPRYVITIVSSNGVLGGGVAITYQFAFTFTEADENYSAAQDAAALLTGNKLKAALRITLPTYTTLTVGDPVVVDYSPTSAPSPFPTPVPSNSPVRMNGASRRAAIFKISMWLETMILSPKHYRPSTPD